MIFDIIVQAIGFIGIGLNIFAVQFNKHWQIVLIKTLGSLAFVIHYIFLKAYTGAAMDTVGIVRNILFIVLVNKRKSTKGWTVVFLLLTIGLGIATWESLISLLGIVAKSLSTISYGIDNPHKIRLLNLPSSICWVVYNTLHFSLAGMLNEVFVIVSIIIAEFRLYYKNKKEKILEGESKNGI